MTLDLNNADLDELDELLASTPEPLEPLDTVMLDGYLAGVAVQPRIMAIQEWLPGVFDIHRRELPTDTVDSAWLARCRSLIERRFEVLTRGLIEEAWFDPVIVDIDQLPPPSEYERPQSDASRTLGAWIAGFQLALIHHPGLRERDDKAIKQALAQIEQHALVANDAASSPPPMATAATNPAVDAVTTTSNAAVDAAVQSLVRGVAELWDLTDEERHHVATIRRDTPKVGRNEPCPCGSGRKYKACHGAS